MGRRFPGNKSYDKEGRPCSVTMASAMDLELTREVFQRYLAICKVLGINEPFMEEVEERLQKLWPIRIGSYGQVLEWFHEYEEVEPRHRHLSHLYGMYPSELWAGEDRMEEAVLGDGEGAWEYLHTLLTRSTYPNLWDAREPFQIDGNFGGIAGIANMLVQDRGGKLKFLPALPKQFPKGYVRGLWIKGNKEVSLCWKNGELTESNISDIGT